MSKSLNKLFLKQQPALFLKYIFKCKETDDYSEFLTTLAENFEEAQQRDWYDFWQAEGDEIVFGSWKLKYADYMPENNEQNEISELVTEGTHEVELTSNKLSEDIESYAEQWDILYQKHFEKVYKKAFIYFEALFYENYLYVQNSLETNSDENIANEIRSEEEDCTEVIDLITEDYLQLELLNLPTAFGRMGRRKKMKRNMSILSKEIEEPIEDEIIMENIDSTDISEKEICNKKMPEYMQKSKQMRKYWNRRFSLFSRFDEGIRLDEEGWFSVTPEKVAKHFAKMLKCHTIIDAFCGCGGNTIQFANFCQKVIAIDIDPLKVEMAKHNAKIYKVNHKIEFIVGDFLKLAESGRFEADIVFLSPPWGGPKYKNQESYNIETNLIPVSASELMKTTRKITENIALYLPRNSDLKQIIKLAGVGKECKVEYSFLDRHVIAITALYGDTIKRK